MHYYQRHIGDYRRDTNALPILEHGAYGLLMDEYYATERRLPARPEDLWRICRAVSKAERLAVSLVAEKFFQLVDGLLIHKRIEEEIAEYREGIETASKAGRASAKSRQLKRNARSTTVDVPLERKANDPTNGTSTNHEPVTSNQVLPLSPRPALSAALAAAVGIGITVSEAEEWWDAREASEWMKGTGGGGTTPVGQNWQSDAKTFTNRARERKASDAAKGRNVSPATPRKAYTDELKEL